MSAPTATPTPDQLQPVASSSGGVSSAVRRLDRRMGGLGRWALPVGVAVPLCIAGAIATGVHAGFPAGWVLGVPNWFDRLDFWVTNHDTSNFFLHTIVGGFGSFLNSSTNDVVHLLHWMTWLGVLLVATLVAWLVGSWRTALFSALMVASFGVLQIPNGGAAGASQMWPSAMTTLSLMAVAIILSTIVGIPL
ncbi:MAG TPA: hypothetical protein VEH79_04140, partial [Gaiellaceae bacterium]|nr:hypothetical protein [Gaiellaceae bacterium]